MFTCLHAVNRCELKDTQSYNLAAKNGIIERKIIRQMLLQTQVTNITAKSLLNMPVIWEVGFGGRRKRKTNILHFIG